MAEQLAASHKRLGSMQTDTLYDSLEVVFMVPITFDVKNLASVFFPVHITEHTRYFNALTCPTNLLRDVIVRVGFEVLTEVVMGYNGLSPAFMLVSCSAYWTLEMVAICYSETSDDFLQTARRYIPEARTLHSLADIGNRKGIYRNCFWKRNIEERGRR
jgi:hypothetical protein